MLQVIRCLLIVPFPESSLNDEAGKLFMDSYEEYARRAQLWTAVHARKGSSDESCETTTSSSPILVMKRKSSNVLPGHSIKVDPKKAAKKRGLKRL